MTLCSVSIWCARSVRARSASLEKDRDELAETVARFTNDAAGGTGRGRKKRGGGGGMFSCGAGPKKR